MKAIVQHRYGAPDLLELREVDMPTVTDDDVLVRVRAASVNPYDWHQVTGTPYLMRLGSGLTRPRRPIPGLDLAGEVEAVGQNVTRFQPGDEVFGMHPGAFAEYAVVPQDKLAVKPANLTFEQAAAVPLAALTALQALRDKGKVLQGKRVLVNGASGGVGTFAVQIAKSLGAQVTGVCGTRSVDLVNSLHADHVIDYTREDFARGGSRYDVIIDLAGNRTVADRRRALAPSGVLVLVGGPKVNRWIGPLPGLVKLRLAGLLGRQTMVGMLARSSGTDLALLRELLKVGSLRPVIERAHPLAEAAEALRHVGAGHAQGKTVLTI